MGERPQTVSVKRAIRSCPRCGSDNVRTSRERGFLERVAALLGVQKVRCRACEHRYSDHPWRPPDVFYARCPACASMILRDWSEKYYLPPFYKRALTYIGWKQQRCEICRINFVSLRRRWRTKNQKTSL